MTAAEPLGSACDKAFVGQYANVMYKRMRAFYCRKYGCKGIKDPFYYAKREIGKQKETIIEMSGIGVRA